MSEKLWTGRFKKPAASITNDFNSSIRVDSLMFEEDITGSIAHVKMLGEMNIIKKVDSEKIAESLCGILNDLREGKLEIDYNAEDIHSFVESELIKRIGDLGKKLHTARSRNDQVALDVRMYLKRRSAEINSELIILLEALLKLAEENVKTVMPGYTHMQRAQPVSFAQQILAYSEMFRRDCGRLADWFKRVNIMPLGSAALAGTGYPINRQMTAQILGFDEVSRNSMDSVSDRDFIIELNSVISIIMAHLSRLAEEMVLFCSWEFKFIELDDAYSTGSSIMPQKKNPDLCELIRGKTGRVYGNLMNILTVMKGLPLAYNKDMQEDKEGVFDSVETVLMCLKTTSAMLSTMKINKEKMLTAAREGFINATDVADYLTKKGMPFRAAYKLTGELVAYCIEKKAVLEGLSLTELKNFSKLFESDIYEEIDLVNCMEKRNSYGGTGSKSVNEQIENLKNYIKTV